MGSLLAILEGRGDQARTIMQRANVREEPETIFYFARHYAMLGDGAETIRLLQRARREGFTASRALEHDRAFEAVREGAGFQQELAEARRAERDARDALRGTGLQLAGV
jgi:hypothetical protein